MGGEEVPYMNYIAAIVSLVATAILTLPILYITDDRITTEREKFKASVKPKKKQVIGYMKGTEPYESEDTQTTLEIIKAKEKEPDDNKNWVCVYQYTVDEIQYEYHSKKRGDIQPNIKLFYEENHPEAAEEESFETNWQGLVLLNALRVIFPVVIFLILYLITSIILQ